MRFDRQGMVRRTLFAMFAAAAALPLAAGQVAASPPGGGQSESTDEITVVGKKDKKVCKNSSATGSILPKRVCRLESEWEDITENSLVGLERIKKQEAREAWIRECTKNC